MQELKLIHFFVKSYPQEVAGTACSYITGKYSNQFLHEIFSVFS